MGIYKRKLDEAYSGPESNGRITKFVLRQTDGRTVPNTAMYEK